MKNKKAKKHNREALKEYFKSGKRPKENHFKNLINSTMNNIDDGISKSVKNSLNDDTKDFKTRGGSKDNEE